MASNEKGPSDIQSDQSQNERKTSTGAMAASEKTLISSCFWLAFCHWIHMQIEKMFAISSRTISIYPKITILVGLLCVACFAIGFAWYNPENRTVKLFIPQNSESMKDLDKAQKHFQLKIREEVVIFVPKAQKNLLSAECFMDALTLHNAVTRLPHYSNLCATLSGKKANSTTDCMFINPLELFNFDEQNMLNISTVLTKASLCSSSPIMSNGLPSCLNINRMFGGRTRNSTTRTISNAEAMRMFYYLRDTSTDADYNEVISWESEFITKISSLQKNMTCASIFYAAERSLDDAIDASSSGDVRYFSLTFTIMISFASVMLGKIFGNPLTGHSVIATGGIVCVALGIAAGFGLSMLAQTPFVKMVGILPYLIVGIAIDDMFIILDELDKQPRDLSVTETVTRVMCHTGATITMTTVTDLVAFAVSTSSQFPSITYFCTYAALTITFAFLFMVTVFVALLTFEVRRIKANRRNCLPFCFAPPPKSGRPWDEPTQPVSSKMMEAWGNFLMKSGTKIVVILISLGLLGAGIYGTVNISENFDRSLLARDNSPFKTFLKVSNKYFGSVIEVSVVVDREVNYENSEVQLSLQQLTSIITENKHYMKLTRSWIRKFTTFCNRHNLTTTGPKFVPNLKMFLSMSAYSGFREDVKFSQNEKRVIASRIMGYIKGSDSSVFQRDAMLSLRRDLAEKSTLGAYPIARSFIFLEQYAIIVRETIRNLSVAAITILVVTSPFLVDPAVTFLVFLGFVALVFELFGLMYIWGISLNSVSMINLVMAIGFAVDYSAHIAHSFLKSTEKVPEKRVVYSLKNIGTSVALGGFSTLLGIFLTSLSSSEIFRIFFKMFLGIVVLGLLHGLCFLPVFLSIFGRWSRPVHAAVVKETRVQSDSGQGQNEMEKRVTPFEDNSEPLEEKKNDGLVLENKCVSSCDLGCEMGITAEESHTKAQTSNERENRIRSITDEPNRETRSSSIIDAKF